MNKFTALLYRLAGTVPEYMAECPASEKQRYVALSVAMVIVGLVTSFSAHHAALLIGLNDPVAWLPAVLWATVMMFTERLVCQALAFRPHHPVPKLPIIVRIALVALNAVALAFFATLAFYQHSNARIRFEEKQQALAHDTAFFEQHYQTAAHATEVADTRKALLNLQTKLDQVPPAVAEGRERAADCQRELESLRALNASKRQTLRRQLEDPRQQPAVYATVADDNASLTSQSVIDQIAALDGLEGQKRHDCADLARKAAEAAREYYGPLRLQRLQQQEALSQQTRALNEASTKFNAAVAESEKVSAAAYGFNLSGESAAVIDLLSHSAFAVAIATGIALWSIFLDSLPILQKVRVRGGPYDRRVAAEEQAFETITEHRFDVEIMKSAAATEKVCTLMPEVTEMSKPLTLFSLSEEEIARARVVKEKAVKADPSRVEEVENAFQAAVAKARKWLRDSCNK